MEEYQIHGITSIKEAKKELLYCGEEALATIMEVYYDIIEASNEQEVLNLLEKFKQFISKHNEKYLCQKK